RLNRVGDHFVRIDRAPPTDLAPRPFESHAPGTGRRRWVAHEAARRARAHHETVLAGVREGLRPLAVVIGGDQRHPPVLDRLRHQSLLPFPLLQERSSVARSSRELTSWGTMSGLPSSTSQNERASRGRHRPAEIHRDLRVLHLAALAGRVVIGVHAVGGLWAVVVHGAAELAYVLDDHVHAVGVALAEVTAGGVVRALAAQLDD